MLSYIPEDVFVQYIIVVYLRIFWLFNTSVSSKLTRKMLRMSKHESLEITYVKTVLFRNTNSI